MKKIMIKIAMPIFFLSMIVNLSIDSNGEFSLLNEVKAAPETTLPKGWRSQEADCLHNGKSYGKIFICFSGEAANCTPTTCPPPPATDAE